jgi:hypothetical protein
MKKKMLLCIYIIMCVSLFMGACNKTGRNDTSGSFQSITLCQ